MKRTIRLRENELRHMIAESVNRTLRRMKLRESIDFENAYTFYKVDIHEPNSDDDVDNEFFDNEKDAYEYAKQQCYNQKLQADIYFCDDEYGDVTSESDFWYCDWEWMDCVGFIDGHLNQF